MPVAFDAASTQTGFNSSFTWSHTTTGSDRALVVAVKAGGSTISSVTYNGVGMTAVETGATNARMYVLANPASGANNIVVTFAGGADGAMVAASYTGVDQTTPYDGVQVSTTGDTAPSVTVSSATDNMVVGCSLGGSLSAVTHTPGAGQTERGDVSSGNDWASLSDEAGASSVTHSYTRTDGGVWYDQRIIAINLRAAGGPPPPSGTPAGGRWRTASRAR